MEKKRFGIRNLLVSLAVILLIALVAVFAATQKREINPTLGELAADPTATPIAEVSPGEEANVRAYLVVTVGGAMYEPIPLYENGIYTVRQGEDMINEIEVTPDSVRMRSSTCDNQDCVEQGVISLENRDKRVLRNMVICLPHEVTLELYTPEEIAQLLLYMAGYTGEEDNE